MVTFVGTQADFLDACKALLELEYDAIEIYTSVINRLQNDDYKKQVSNFKKDHEKHIVKLTAFLEDHQVEFIKGPDGKQLLLIGMVAISNIIGDDITILKAFINAENDTVKAYENMVTHKDIIKGAEGFLQQGLRDENKHRDWIKSVIGAS